MKTTTKKPKKILVALQMWEGDAAEVTALARLLTDIQNGEFNPHADLLLVYRRDCPPRPELASYCRSGFENVYEHTTRPREVGYPAGPNGMWCDVMEYSLTQHKLGKWNYDCIFTTEGDAIPLRRDWAEVLISDWRDAGSAVVGRWMNSGEHACGHINGNAMFHPRLSEMIPISSCSARRAWDTSFALLFHRLGWTPIENIINKYSCPTLARHGVQELANTGAAWLHGVKDGSARKWARSELVARD